MTAVPQRLVSVPLCGLVPVSMDEANALLEEWGHYLGPCDRPFRSEAWALDLLGTPVSIAVTSSIVSETVAGYHRSAVVELARLCTRPGDEWATRVMLRLWRQVAARRYLPWTPRAAVAYSKNDRHDGRIYRFDGWRKITDRAGSSGGRAWSRKRYAGEAAHGAKTLWLWEFVTDERRSEASKIPLPASKPSAASQSAPVTGIAAKPVNACTSRFSERPVCATADFVTAGGGS